MKYKLIKQEPFCCVPRCLQMILDRYNITYESQMNIAKELGYRNDDKYKGTQINKESCSIQNYFLNHKIPLKFEYFYITDLVTAREFLINNINNDIITCYKRGVMFNKKMDGGHATLVEKIENDIITLIYPEDNLGYRKVSLENLLKAIEYHGKENMAGFWLISKI